MPVAMRRALILCALFALGATAAHSFAPVAEREDLAIPAPGAERVPTWETTELQPALHPEAAAFEGRAGAGWRYQWNALTGTPHAVYGAGVQLTGGPIATESAAEAAARSFIAQNAAFLGADPAGLRVRSVVNAMGKWGVIFDQLHQGIEVEGARLRLVMTESGRLYYFGSDLHPSIRLGTSPLLDAAAAARKAASEVRFIPGRDLDEGGELLILPVPEGEGMGYRLVWRVRHRVEEPFAIWVSYVDAATGEVVWRYDDVCYANVVGTTAGNVEDYGYCYGEQDRRLPNMRVAVTGGNSGYSDLQGNYEITHSGTAPVTVTAQLDGRWINVNDQLDGDGTFTGTATPGVAFEIRWTDAWENDAARDIYLHGNRIHDAAKQYDPSWTSPDYRMSATANIASTCNAYWDGSTINFYRAGGGCGNTGQMGDVIYHEYAHGMTQWIYGNNPSDVGEGNSDTAALLLDRNSICGEGFYLNQCASGIRNAENTLIYPDDYQPGQIHFNGQFISGFYWDSRQELVLIYGEEGVTDVLWPIWHFARRLIQPFSMPDQILAAFVTDDDDGNLNNGTPHYDALCVGATNHGFDCPERFIVDIAHEHLDATEEGGVPFTVDAQVEGYIAPIDPTKVWMDYAVDGGAWVRVEMTNVAGDHWQAVIPGQWQPAAITYYLHAEDLEGNIQESPIAGASDPHHVEVGYLVEPFEAGDAGFTVGDTGDNATTGIWVRVDPNGTLAQPENDDTGAGTHCWVTGQGAVGGGAGDADVDGGKTTLKSAVYDLTGASIAVLKYWRWFSNDKGNNPGTDAWVVQVNNNGGAWTNIENTTASSNAWVQREVDLAALYGEGLGQVQVKFIATDNSPGSLIEAAVDDLVLLVRLASGAEEDAARNARFALHEVRPNPVHSTASIRYETATGSLVSLSVHDVSGRLVRRIHDGLAVGSGTHDAVWDGRDDGGRRVGSGVYFIRFKSAGLIATRPVVVTR